MIEFNKAYKYRDLCKTLDIEVLNGGYQRTQLSRLDQTYDIEKTSDKKYIIHKQYNDVELLENKKYGQIKAYFTPILYTLLLSAENNVIQCTNRELMEIFFLVNKDFSYAKWNTEKVDDIILNGDGGFLGIFITEMEMKNKRIIREMLNDMADKKLIQLNKILKFGKKIRLPNGEYRTKIWSANKEIEIPIFLEAQHKAMEANNVSSWEQYEKLSYYIRKEGKVIITDYVRSKINMDYYYYEYEIILNKKDIKETLIKNINDVGNSFNSLICEKVRTSTSKGLLSIPIADKDAYIDALINSTKDYKLREKI